MTPAMLVDTNIVSSPLVTHNRKHFENVPGLTVISEG